MSLTSNIQNQQAFLVQAADALSTAEVFDVDWSAYRPHEALGSTILSSAK